MTNEITKRCPMSSQVAPETRDPTFDKAQHVTCPECHRTLYVREGTNLYPSHYVRVSPTRNDEIAKTRINTIPGLYVEGRGKGWHTKDGEATGKRKWQVHRLTYRDHSYLLWRVSEEYMWSISPYNPFEETHLAIAESLEAARGIVVDWGEGGSVYENPGFRPGR